MYIVDTHQHLWDLQRFPYSWCAGIPALNRSFLFDDYVAASEGCGIEKTVFMECDVDEPYQIEEARHIQALAEQHPLIAGIVASARPERDDFDDQLDQLAALSKLRGVRRVLHTQPDELSRTDLFARNIQKLGPRGLSFDLCVLARQLPVAIDLVRRCPDVPFILDHCGVPDVRQQALDPWRQHIVELARFENVTCKISGLVAYADPTSWRVDDLRPFVEHVLHTFGWHRVVWGGDWPVCTLSATLKAWVRATQELIAHATGEQKAGLLHRNAERIYCV
jgi:predicted TIM-barrel fold metal-dependent hydrolase